MPKSTSQRLPDFRRAAEQRLATAEFLLKYGFHLDAMYLSGYAVECSLKAVIMGSTPRRKWLTQLADFRGYKGHSFDALKEKLRTRNITMPPAVITALRSIATWSTALRYEVGFRGAAEARQFVGAAQAILEWSKKKL